MLTARDVMTQDVEVVAPDDEVGDVLSKLAKAEFNGFPVLDSVEQRSTGSRNASRSGDDGELVGIVTQGDLVRLFQTEERVLWIPVGLPPFTETVKYAVDVSWDDLDLGVDLARNVNKPVREVMSTDVVTVAPDDDIDRILDLLSGRINRLPVLTEAGALVGIVTREDVIRALRDERRAE
ncbi:CBS domain-containing protein [Halomarina oriensis]|uniref:CBS domain-containing protein n=1 Tax=Halomarina oriensis TaxID=671145 RepID=A0A6B0GNG3_9EURY|nr:CBS domain-containing protein [Halomarina oriensis]MWG33665.1 CBS domain-containing protein [Halomarina oriensis]